MKITESQLRRIIKEELYSIREDDASSAASASSLSDSQKKKLKAFAGQPPSSLGAFSASMKTLGAILGDIDEKAANINADQIKKYFQQIMVIIDSMMSEEKTSSTETGKIKKAIGV